MMRISLLSGALLCACGSSSGSSGPEVDASTLETGARDGGGDGPVDSAIEGGEAGTPVYKALSLTQTNECFPYPLPTNGSMAACRVLLDGISAGCESSGLSSATPADLAAINAIIQARGQQPPQGALCVLAQVTGTAGSGCSDQQSPGWCYVLGACLADAGVSCNEDLCTTPEFASDSSSYTEAWLACP